MVTKRHCLLFACLAMLLAYHSSMGADFPRRFAIESPSPDILPEIALIGDGLSAAQGIAYINWGSIQTNPPVNGVNVYVPFPSNSWWAAFLDELDATDRGLVCTLEFLETPWAIERDPNIMVQNPQTGDQEPGLIRIYPEYTNTWQAFITHLLEITPQITHLQIENEAENVWVHVPGYIEALRLAYDAVQAFNSENPGRDVKVLSAGYNLGGLIQVPEEYLQMIVTNYPAKVDFAVLKEAFPNVSDDILRLWSRKLHLVVGVLSQEDPGAPSFDILTVHHDSRRTYDSSGNLVAWYRNRMATGVNGAYDRPIWVDDMSSNYLVTSNGNASAEDLLLLQGLDQGDAATIAAYNAKHPEWLVKKAVGHFAAGIERVSIAYGHDMPSYFLPIWRYMGLYTTNSMVKPVYHTTRLMVEKLDGFTSATRIQQADTNNYLYRFSFAAKPDVFVAWRENEGIMDLSAYATSATLLATHLVMETTPQGDAIWSPDEEFPKNAVSVTPVPVFLEASSRGTVITISRCLRSSISRPPGVSGI